MGCANAARRGGLSTKDGDEMDRLIAIALIIVYGGMMGYVWGFWRHRPAERYPQKTELAILACALVFHAYWVWSPLLRHGMTVMGFSHALNLIVWLMLTLYCVGGFFYSLRGLQILLYPLAVLALALAAVFPSYGLAGSPAGAALAIHAGSSLLAYSLFGVSALIAALLIRVEGDLRRRRRMSNLVKFMPPLLSVEVVMFDAIWAGFALLTLSIVTGFLQRGAQWGGAAALSHKNVFAVLSWLIYASLLWFRVRHSWRGERAAWWVVIGFTSLLLAYLGSRIVLAFIWGA